MRRQFIVFLALLVFAQHGQAAGAHVHGQGQLDISIDGDRVEMMLIAPLSDLQTEAAGGPEALADRDDLFRFEGVTCDFEASAVTSADVFEDMWAEADVPDPDQLFEDGDETQPADAPVLPDDADDPKYDLTAHAEHHADHEEHHDHQQGHHADHEPHHGEHDDHPADHDDAHGSGHSDSYISWIYRCSTPPTSISVELFTDTRLEKLDVQVATASATSSRTLSAGDTRFQLP